MRHAILVVEDKPTHRTFIADTLRTGGYEVLEAANADEARDKLRRHAPIHLVILDQMMPGMKGTALWNQIKADDEFRECRKMPVIFVTAFPEDEEIRRVKADGVQVLAKPLRDYHDILDAAKRALRLP